MSMSSAISTTERDVYIFMNHVSRTANSRRPWCDKHGPAIFSTSRTNQSLVKDQITWCNAKLFNLQLINNWWRNCFWCNHALMIQEAQLSLTNPAMLVCKVVEVCMQDFLSEYVDKKFTYICYGRLIRHEWIYYGSKNCVIYNSYKIV